jgi:type III secretion protein L
MAKVIKRSGIPEGDVSPDTGFVESPVRRAAVIERDTFEARSEGQQIRERALGEAEEIRRQAEAEAEKIKEEAYTKGYEEGRDAGAAELMQVISKHAQKMAMIEHQAVPQLRDLAITIARKIIGRELEFNPDAVIDVVKQALSEKARQRREIFLRVNPADLQAIRDRKPELIEVLSRAKEIGLREDPDVARHGVIIETDAGTIDAQLETQLAVIERELKNLG